ncbi:MAG: 3-oxo-tetronate kinase [Bosea sp. (in: a-proteobacteria)]
MLLGCIADDFTGASDLANTLAKGGMATTQFVGIPSKPADAACEAGVVSLKSRTIPASEAVQQSLQALDWLLAQGCRQILFKYCSTFDSTPEGNIGPVAEALLDRLGGIAVVCPVFPATGRTLFHGHLFVNGQLLSETGMRNHPLTPMTDPDIARWLRLQTRGEVGRVAYPVVRQGAAAIRAALASEQKAGRRLIVTDAVVDDDLLALGEAIAGYRLVTGGSGIALGLPSNFRRAGLLAGDSSAKGTQEKTGKAISGTAAALSGSCSVQSLKQVALFAKSHPVLTLEPGAILDGSMTVAKALAWMLERIEAMPMAASSATAEAVRAAQEKFGREKAAGAIEHFMGELARGLVEAGVTRLVVGGGETSGAVVSALSLNALAIGPEIDPGVPVLMAKGGKLKLALKSGNFGADDFYEKAARMMAG